MANVLKINGTTTVLGQEVRNVMGGFGEGNKCILAQDVAKVHNVKLIHINELINRNIKRFTSDDLLDLKVIADSDNNLEEFGFTKMQISKANNIFALSERGYMKLVSAMSNDNDKKWEVMDTLIEEYFRLKEENISLKESNDNLKEIATSDESVDKRALKVQYNDMFRNTMIKKSFRACEPMELKKFYRNFKELSEAINVKPQDMKIKYKHIIDELESMLTPESLANSKLSGGEYTYIHELVSAIKDDKNENDNRINGGKKSAQTKTIKAQKEEIDRLNKLVVELRGLLDVELFQE